MSSAPQTQVVRRFGRQPAPHLAVILHETFAQVVDQQGQVQHPLVLDAAVGDAQRTVVRQELGRAFHGPNRVLVDRVLVISVELHQSAGVGHRGNDFLQHPQLVQSPQEFAQHSGLRNQRQEPLRSLRRHLDLRAMDHRFADRPPGRRMDAILVAIGQVHQPQHLGEIRTDLLQTTARGRDMQRIDAEVAIDVVAEDRPNQGQQGSPPFRFRQEVGNRVLHFVGMLDVVTQESLDGQQLAIARVAESLGNPQLLIAAQYILRPSRLKMQFVAQTQQELMGLDATCRARQATARPPVPDFPVHGRRNGQTRPSAADATRAGPLWSV